MEELDILVVDDDNNLNFALCETLRQASFQVDSAPGFLQAREKLQFIRYPMVITDVRMPDGSGIDLVSFIHRQSPETVILVLTAYGTVEDAVKALKTGARDYLLKPVSAPDLTQWVRTHFPGRFRPRQEHQFLTRNPATLELLERARRAARQDVPVVITGESGTGKEVLARWIHRHSRRAEQPYVALNCAAIPENLLESELFGYEKGAFTGADKLKPGKFELAHRGTLVLDEIGDMSLMLQAKLLRVLQEGELDRLGGRQPIPVDVRILALTNRDLSLAMREGRFREDLYYRLAVVSFQIPPLRERLEDIPFLATHFLEFLSQQSGLPPVNLSESAQRKLAQHPWPGNIRELQNTLQRAMIFAQESTLGAEDIEWMSNLSAPGTGPELLAGSVTVAEMERELIFKTLEKTGNNRKQAAEILGISARTLRNKLAEYRGEPPGDAEDF